MNKKLESILLFAMFVVYMGYDSYHAYKVESKMSDDVQYLAKTCSSMAIFLANTNDRIDSVQIQNKALAKSIVFVDSCNQAKIQKSDRAERRGKFVGGLLKGLFPGL
jgi:hypothetical protein